MRTLVTGFEPFGTDSINPSWQAVAALAEHYGTHDVEVRLIPVTFVDATRIIEQCVTSGNYDAIILTGYSAQAQALTVETCAVNWADSRIPDNAGYHPHGEFLDPRMPARTTIDAPWNAGNVVATLSERGHRVVQSWDAGQYVCNASLYTLARACHDTQADIRGGFVHIPPTAMMPTHEVALALHDLVAIVGAS